MNVEVNGSPFTRDFRVTFTAPSDQIVRWLERSPGTADEGLRAALLAGTPQQLTPRGGASFAELAVSPETGKKRTVSIHACWS